MQPTPPGWYLDPMGQPSLWRWFTGRTWTQILGTDPRAGSPVPLPELAPGADGRVCAGGLSFPVLDDPWHAAPAYLDLDDEAGQELVVATSGRGPYIACVFLGGLPAKYPYAGPADLASAGEALAADLLSTYYPHEHAHDRGVRSEDDVDGHAAWRTDIDLDIDDPALTFASEAVGVVVVDTGEGSAGVCYASLPVLEPVPAASEVLGQLRVVR